MHQLVVLKFGGTSVGDADARRRVLTIIEAERRPRVVVVSALSGVTDALLRAAAAGGIPPALRAVDALLDRHLRAAGAVRDAAARRRLEQDLRHDAAEVTAALARSGGPADRAARDVVAAAGELWSSRLLTALLTDAGSAAEWIDARQVLRTIGEHGAAAPDLEATRRAAARLLAPAVAAGRVAVLGGFIGSDASGSTTTIGRGGSDYSAAVFGASLDAAEIQIWTDVDGILTADPRILPHARLVPHVSYGEAHDLAFFGAKVLHPGTITPAVERNIPVLVRNSYRPAVPGTCVTARERIAPGRGIAGLACRTGITLADVIARPGIDAAALTVQVFDTLDASGLEAILVDERADRLVLALQPVASPPPHGTGTSTPGEMLRVALTGAADVRFRDGLATVAMVGEDLGADAVRAAAWALRDVPVFLTARPAGGRCIAVVVDAALAPAAMARLHDCFFLAGERVPSVSRDMVQT